MTRLIVTRSAKADVAKTLDYLEHEAGANTAERYTQQFRDAIVRLAKFPESGAPRPALGKLTRIIVIYPYVMIYDYERNEDVLTILRILHGKTLISARLLRHK